jgi:Dolichyl-phosphate-mannose-protein mannosyltransferase
MIDGVAGRPNSIQAMYRASEETAAPQRPPARPIRDLGRFWLAALGAVLLVAVGLRIGFALDPQRPQEPDSIGYARIAKSLYRDGSFEEGGKRTHLQEPSNYSPGLPLFVAGLYELTGGVHLELARIVLALIGSLAVLFAFLIGNRLSGPGAGLFAALAVTVYPALLQYQGMLMTEPLAATLLAGSLLAFLWASDGRGQWAWALPGSLLGLLALVRPEYLLFGLLLPLLALLRGRREGGGWRPGIAAGTVMAVAFLLPVAPWTVRNAVVLDRFVPVSTGGGKALFIGTYMRADGDGPRLREELLRRHPDLLPALIGAPRTAYLDTELNLIAARRHPGLPTDAALGKMGRENLRSDISDHPLGFAGMLARKSYRAWREGPRKVMESWGWKAAQKGLVLLALLGLVVLAARRRWEALPIALLLIGVTATSALLIASPRRVIVILPAIAALAGTGASWLVERARALS